MVCRPVSMKKIRLKKSAGFHSCRQVHRQVVTGDLGSYCGNYIKSHFFLQNDDSFWVAGVNKSDLSDSAQINACLDPEKRLWFISRWMGPAGATSCDNKSNQRVRAALHRSCSRTRVQEKSRQQECLLHVSLAHEPGFRLKETLFKQFSVLALFFSSFLHPFFSSLPLILSSPKYVWRACAEQTWGVNSRDQRKPNVRYNRWIYLLLSILHLLSPPSPCLSLWTSWVWRTLSLGLRAQRIPWQRSTSTDGRRTETDFGFGWSSGISRTFLGLVSHCILLFRSYLIRKGL